MAKSPGKILIVDDDQDVLYTARMALKPHFQSVNVVSEPRKIPKLLSEQSFDVILLDMNFGPGLTSGNEGLRWLKKILSIDPKAHVLLNTAYGDIELAVNGMKAGAIDFIAKPWTKDKLVATVKSVCKLSQSQQELERMRQTQEVLNQEIDSGYPEMISEAPAMEKVFDTIRKVAVTDADVLILGENGTGKELAARAIHKQSNRSRAPFIKVDVGALSETLFESELFGHVKGAFTDAKEDRAGRFEIASGGTLFLDEIGNLSLPLQAKLLTALQSRQVTRIGSNKAISVDIRLICATNKPLYEKVAEEEFRQDLLYRINTVEVRIPPLRERKEDIFLLAEHYLEVFRQKYQKPEMKLDKRSLKRMADHNWPGNVRELQHCMERAVILSDGPLLEIASIGGQGESTTYRQQNDSLNLEEIEREAILLAVKKCNGNLTKAARELGFGRSTLYRKMEKYGIK